MDWTSIANTMSIQKLTKIRKRPIIKTQPDKKGKKGKGTV